MWHTYNHTHQRADVPLRNYPLTWLVLNEPNFQYSNVTGPVLPGHDLGMLPQICITTHPDTVLPIRVECINVATVNIPPKMAAFSVISVKVCLWMVCGCKYIANKSYRSKTN